MDKIKGLVVWFVMDILKPGLMWILSLFGLAGGPGPILGPDPDNLLSDPPGDNPEIIDITLRGGIHTRGRIIKENSKTVWVKLWGRGDNYIKRHKIKHLKGVI